MSSSAKQPNLHLTAAAASRDVTPFQSLALLHQADYDLSKAMCFLVPPAHKQWYPIDADKATALHTSTLGGPLMCRDQLEEWSAAEANLFDEALEKYGKDFNDIRQDFVRFCDQVRFDSFNLKRSVTVLASLESSAGYCRILLYVENYRSVRSAKTRQSERSRISFETSLYPGLYETESERFICNKSVYGTV